MNGWLKLHRKLPDTAVWKQTAPAVAKVLVYFLCRANHKPTSWYDGKQQVQIPAGSFITSYATVAKDNNISKMQTRDAFLHLMRTQFATYKRTHRWTLVSICNWSRYQHGESDENTVKDCVRNTPENTPENTQGTPDEEAKKLRREEASEDSAPFDQDGKVAAPSLADAEATLTPSDAEKLPWIREQLADFPGAPGPAPDDWICRRVLAALNGASLAQLGELLKRLARAGKKPKCWAFFPAVVREEFKERK